MAQSLLIPPPGFDSLSIDEKIDYVESLWDTIAHAEEVLPVPDWHRQVIRERLQEHRASPDSARPWSEVRLELEQKYLTRR